MAKVWQGAPLGPMSCRRTMKYFHALAAGAWVVTPAWLAASAAAGAGLQAEFEELESEHMDLLVLLSNQEVERGVLLAELERRCGAEAAAASQGVARAAVEKAEREMDEGGAF